MSDYMWYDIKEAAGDTGDGPGTKTCGFCGTEVPRDMIGVHHQNCPNYQTYHKKIQPIKDMHTEQKQTQDAVAMKTTAGPWQLA
jgi:hypothetical protein